MLELSQCALKSIQCFRGVVSRNLPRLFKNLEIEEDCCNERMHRVDQEFEVSATPRLLRYQLRMSGVPLIGPADIFCDSGVPTMDFPTPESTMEKKHHNETDSRTGDGLMSVPPKGRSVGPPTPSRGSVKRELDRSQKGY
jgi:hypothetical protein